MMEGIYDQISKSRKVLELPESATIKQIRKNYRRLVKEWHPDKSIIHMDIDQLKAKEIRTNEIIRAYKIISAYCSNYRYSFERGEVEKHMTDRERWFRQFGSVRIRYGLMMGRTNNSNSKSKMISRRRGLRRRRRTVGTLRSRRRANEGSALIWDWNNIRQDNGY